MSFFFAWGDTDTVSVPGASEGAHEQSQSWNSLPSCGDKITTTAQRAFRCFHTASGSQSGRPELQGSDGDKQLGHIQREKLIVAVSIKVRASSKGTL